MAAAVVGVLAVVSLVLLPLLAERKRGDWERSGADDAAVAVLSSCVWASSRAGLRGGKGGGRRELPSRGRAGWLALVGVAVPEVEAGVSARVPLFIIR